MNTLTLKAPDYGPGLLLACNHLEKEAKRLMRMAEELEAILAADLAKHGARCFGVEQTRKDVNDRMAQAALLRGQIMMLKELK